MHFIGFILRRMIYFVPQLLGIVLVSFFLIKSIPGDPASLMLGPMATPESLEKMRDTLGLNESLPMQFWIYVSGLAHGDLGTSWQSSRPVLDDMLDRFPATLELVTFSLLLAISIGMPLGIATAMRPSGVIAKITDIYGLIAGAVPDFWLGLVLIFIFYSVLQIVPAPLGRLDYAILAPPKVTGFLTIDSLLAWDLAALKSSLAHLILPVLALGLVTAGPILKITGSTLNRMLVSDFSSFGVLCGLPESTVTRRALRNALPSVVTIISVLYGYLIGGAVLVEIIFAWGGAGQYAVQGLLSSDIYPVLGFVLFSAIVSLVVYLLVDIIYFIIDPRIKH